MDNLFTLNVVKEPFSYLKALFSSDETFLYRGETYKVGDARASKKGMVILLYLVCMAVVLGLYYFLILSRISSSSAIIIVLEIIALLVMIRIALECASGILRRYIPKNFEKVL